MAKRFIIIHVTDEIRAQIKKDIANNLEMTDLDITISKDGVIKLRATSEIDDKFRTIDKFIGAYARTCLGQTCDWLDMDIEDVTNIDVNFVLDAIVDAVMEALPKVISERLYEKVYEKLGEFADTDPKFKWSWENVLS